MTVRASVSLFWQPYGFDVEPTSPLDERERLGHVVAMCDDVHNALATFFPEQRIKSDLILDIETGSATPNPLVLEEELLGVIEPALNTFDVTKAMYDELSDAQKKSLDKLDFNLDRHKLESGRPEEVVLNFGAELSTTGYRGRYYYYDGGKVHCCSTGIALLSNGQPVRVRSNDVEAEADVLLRSEFVLIEGGSAHDPA